MIGTVLGDILRVKNYFIRNRIILFLSCLIIMTGCTGPTDVDVNPGISPTPDPMTSFNTPTSPSSANFSFDSLLDLPKIREGNAQKLVEVHTIDEQATTLAFSPDGTWLAVGTWDKGIYIYDLRTMEPIQRIPGKSLITGLSFSTDKTMLAASANTTLSADNTITTVFIYNTNTWDLIVASDLELQAESGFYLDTIDIFKGTLHFTADNRIILTNGHTSRLKESQVIVFRIQSNSLMEIQRLQIQQNYSCWGSEVFPDGNTIFTGDSIYDLTTGFALKQLQFDQRRATTGAVSSDGSLVAYASLGSTQIHIAQSADLRRKINLDGFSGKVLAIDFSTDGSVVAASSRDHNLLVWNVSNAEIVARMKGTYSTIFSPKGNLLATIHADTRDDEDPQWLVRLYGITDPTELIQEPTLEPEQTVVVQTDTPAIATNTLVPPVTSTPVHPTALSEPIPTNTPAISYPSWSACPYSLPSYLHPGMTAYVAYGTGANRIRQEPGLQSEIVGMLPEGQVVYLYDGPSCTDDWVWWKIDGGWTAESGDAYWLIPCQVGADCPQ